MSIVIGLLIPFLGTTIGSAMVFLMKNRMNKKTEKLLLGFASGVMIAAAFWSLLLPSIEMSEKLDIMSCIPASVGFLIGIIFLLILDNLIPHLHLNRNKPHGVESKLKKTTMFVLAVTIHNIPEGMSLGVTFAGVLVGNTGITLASAFALATGIAIQNFPDGAIVSIPLKSEGMSKTKSFVLGMLSGIVEPISAIIIMLFAKNATLILPYVLSFAAGTTLYVVADDLIPESQEGKKSNLGIIGLAIGFVLMMILDITIG